MRGVRHISPSAMEKFIACPAWWATAYDDELKFNTRTDYTDVGTLVHGALEKWRNPNDPKPQTFEALEQCFRDVCAELQLVESLAVYKRGQDIIRKAFEIDSINRHLPMSLAVTWAVEYEIKDYFGVPYGQPPKWPRKMVGYIDRIALIQMPGIACGPGMEYLEPKQVPHILVVEDYKTGRAKSWSEITEEEIQPSSYLCYAQDVLVPLLRSQGYNIARTVLLWSYIDHGIAIPVQETDIDTDDVREYIGNIATQMIIFKEKYEEITDEIAAFEEMGQHALAEQLRGELARFLAGFERVNAKCSWCSRKAVCENFNRQLNQKIVVDLTLTDMERFFADRDRYAAIHKAAEEARKAYDSAYRAYLDHMNKENVIVGDRLWHANSIDGSYHAPAVVAELLGEAFVLNSAKISKEAISAEVARIATFDPERAAKVSEELERRIVPGVGARVVKSRKLRPAEKKKLEQEQQAS